MTCRKNLIFGLLLAMPIAAPAVSLGADSSPGSSGVATWKKSSQPTAPDIRFKRPAAPNRAETTAATPKRTITTTTPSRPETFIFTDQPTPPSTPILAVPKNKPAIALAKPAVPPSLAPISAPAAASAASIAAPNAVPTVARAKAMPAPASAPPISQSPPASPAPVLTPIAAPAAALPAAQPAVTPQAAAPVSAPAVAATTSLAVAAPTPAAPAISDEQIQQVAQLLIDRGVVRAADDEPLPASPHSPIPSESGRGDGHNFDSSYGDGACGDDCGDSCCPPPPRLFWVGGVEATFLWPDLNSEGVSFAAEEVTDERYDSFTSQDTDTDSMYMSPRIWLGVQGCAWGANIRYWHMQAGEGQYDPSIGGQGTWDDYDCGRSDIGFFSCNQTEAYTIDLEITRRFCIHDCWMQAAIGVRHAEIQDNESITGLALTDEGLLSGFARANRQSRGTGLLLGLYGRKPLYPCSCVHWFYNARISTLWGPTQTAAETFAAVQASDPNFIAGAASVNGAYTTVDDTLFIGEIQLGLEWDYALACLPANAFFRTAIEYQRWDGGRGYSAANSFAGIAINNSSPTESIVSTTAGAPEPQMDLFGFTIGTGLTW